MNPYDTVLAALPRRGGFVRVGIDGVDGAGKTTFADTLAVRLRQLGRPVVRIGADDFLQCRAERYRQGRHSSLGFFEDSYNYPRLITDAIAPFAADGAGQHRHACHDLVTDRPRRPRVCIAAPGSVLVLDGLFLHRDELAGCWDVSVFLDVPFTVSVPRMAARDGSDPDPEHPSMRRYVQGQRIYLDRCRPAERADLVFTPAELDGATTTGR